MSALLGMALDHVVIVVRDIEAAARSYERLLNRAAAPAAIADGVATALVVTDNIAVELMCPVGESERARRASAALETGGEGLKSLVLATSEIEHAHERAMRVGLDPEPIVTKQDWRSFRLGAASTHGVRLFVIQRHTPLTPSPSFGDGVSGLDHIVIRTGDADRAAALYGARIRLDMRLDRVVRGNRLLFFRCADAVIEIACDSALKDAPDQLWGLSWRVADLDAAQERLSATGLDVSEVRAGAKPGTRVFTVRDGTCGVPTLMIEPSSKRN